MGLGFAGPLTLDLSRNPNTSTHPNPIPIPNPNPKPYPYPYPYPKPWQEKEHAARADRKMRRDNTSQSNMPQVMDYVQQKAEMYDLERSLNTWRRKVEIAEVEARRHHSLAAKQRAAQGAA